MALSTKKRKLFNRFLQHLQETYPIPEEVDLTIRYHDSYFVTVKPKGHPPVEVTGGIRASAKAAQIRVAVKQGYREIDGESFRRRPTASILRTIAHEYKHVVQRCVEGRVLQPGVSSPTEREARKFERPAVERFLEELGEPLPV